MNEHNIFKTPMRPVIMMMIGVNCILGDLQLSVLLGIGIYVAAVWMERIWKDR
ncbi:MAG: hypothetical protein K2N44_06565 [Lachnospiraceae bacterium]|nr:hypothetical protein [Lachnospiraceae bacterium]